MSEMIDDKELDRRFDADEDVLEHFDLSSAVRMNEQTRKVNLTMPQWLVEGLDRAARHYAIPRQAVINMWLAERLEKAS